MNKMKIEEYKEGAMCPNCMIPMDYKFSETGNKMIPSTTLGAVGYCYNVVARIYACPKCFKHWSVKE